MARSPTDTTKFLTLDELGRLFTALNSPGMAAGDTTVGNGPDYAEPTTTTEALCHGKAPLLGITRNSA